MQKAINKVKTIKKAALAYQNNFSLFYRHAVKLHRVSAQLVIYYYNNEIISAPDVFITD